MPIEEIWGVGSRLKQHLNKMGIKTALELADTDTKLIRRRFSIVLERTVMELRGYPCIGLEEHPSTKKEIVKVTAIPTQKPRATPPLTNPISITQLGVVETNNSSKLLLYLVIKNDETVLA
jgi:nucleotidyltransferase/DNA polymerase involved in DNA repair